MALAPQVTTLNRRKAAPKPPPGPVTVKVENRIGVQAPAEVIWDLLYDVAGWERWNPLHKRAQGEIRIGARLTALEALPGRPERETQLVVIEWVPCEQLHLRNAAMGGWVKSIRYIEIEQLDKASCIVSTGELFAAGMLVKLHLRKQRRALRQGFAAHGEALKAAAEARWRESGQGAGRAADGPGGGTQRKELGNGQQG